MPMSDAHEELVHEIEQLRVTPDGVRFRGKLLTDKEVDELLVVLDGIRIPPPPSEAKP